MVRPVLAANVYFVGTNGVSATTNWSDTANWLQINTTTPMTPNNNEANFNYNTMASSPGLVTLNVDGAYGSPGSGLAQAWGMFFTQTNGYQTILIQPGITLALQAASGTPGGGNFVVAPAGTNNGGSSGGNTPGNITYTNYTTFTGAGGTFTVNCTVFRIEGASSATPPVNHYTILDMSGLGTLVMTNTAGAALNFDLINNGGTRSQGLVYLAKTNVLGLNGLFQVGNLGTSSNSLPVGVYLGQSNYILTATAANDMLIGSSGCTNGFMQFNPALIGGATMPSAFITAPSGNQSAVICSATGGAVPGYAICDFTGGNVTWIGNSLKLGVAGAASPSTAADGVLTFDNGTVTFSTILVGDQSVSAGAPGAGTINIGTNATLQASTSITLGATTGTLTSGTAGTINVNGGVLNANTIINSLGTGTINLSNGTFTVTTTAGTPASPITSVSITNSTLNFVTSLTATNVVAGTLTTSGANVVNITSVPPLSSVPTVIKLIAYSGSIGGAGYDFSLGALPPQCAGSLSNDTANSSIDLVLTSGPLGLTWDGDLNGNWDTTETNWFAAGPEFLCGRRLRDVSRRGGHRKREPDGGIFAGRRHRDKQFTALFIHRRWLHRRPNRAAQARHGDFDHRQQREQQLQRPDHHQQRHGANRERRRQRQCARRDSR